MPKNKKKDVVADAIEMIDGNAMRAAVQVVEEHFEYDLLVDFDTKGYRDQYKRGKQVKQILDEIQEKSPELYTHVMRLPICGRAKDLAILVENVDAKKIKLGQNTFSTVKKDNWTGGKKPQDYMQADNARYAVFARSDYAEYTDLASRDFVNTLNELNKMTEGKKDFDKEVLAVGLKLKQELENLKSLDEDLYNNVTQNEAYKEVYERSQVLINLSVLVDRANITKEWFTANPEDKKLDTLSQLRVIMIGESAKRYFELENDDENLKNELMKDALGDLQKPEGYKIVSEVLGNRIERTKKVEEMLTWDNKKLEERIADPDKLHSNYSYVKAELIVKDWKIVWDYQKEKAELEREKANANGPVNNEGEEKIDNIVNENAQEHNEVENDNLINENNLNNSNENVINNNANVNNDAKTENNEENVIKQNENDNINNENIINAENAEIKSEENKNENVTTENEKKSKENESDINESDIFNEAFIEDFEEENENIDNENNMFGKRNSVDLSAISNENEILTDENINIENEINNLNGINNLYSSNEDKQTHFAGENAVIAEQQTLQELMKTDIAKKALTLKDEKGEEVAKEYLLDAFLSLNYGMQSHEVMNQEALEIGLKLGAEIKNFRNEAAQLYTDLWNKNQLVLGRSQLLANLAEMMKRGNDEYDKLNADLDRPEKAKEKRTVIQNFLIGSNANSYYRLRDSKDFKDILDTLQNSPDSNNAFERFRNKIKLSNGVDDLLKMPAEALKIRYDKVDEREKQFNRFANSAPDVGWGSYEAYPYAKDILNDSIVNCVLQVKKTSNDYMAEYNFAWQMQKLNEMFAEQKTITEKARKIGEKIRKELKDLREKNQNLYDKAVKDKYFGPIIKRSQALANVAEMADNAEKAYKELDNNELDLAENAKEKKRIVQDIILGAAADNFYRDKKFPVDRVGQFIYESDSKEVSDAMRNNVFANAKQLDDYVKFSTAELRTKLKSSIERNKIYCSVVKSMAEAWSEHGGEKLDHQKLYSLEKPKVKRFAKDDSDRAARRKEMEEARDRKRIFERARNSILEVKRELVAEAEADEAAWNDFEDYMTERRAKERETRDDLRQKKQNVEPEKKEVKENQENKKQKTENRKIQNNTKKKTETKKNNTERKTEANRDTTKKKTAVIK